MERVNRKEKFNLLIKIMRMIQPNYY